MIKSKVKIGNVATLFLGGIVMIVLASYLIKTAFNSEYPQIIGLILGGLIGLVGIVSCSSLFFLNSFAIDKEKFIVKTLFGNTKKVIYLSEIVSYTEIEKENKKGKWKDLTIYTKTNKIKLSSFMVLNYMEFRKILIKGKKQDLEIEKFWSTRVKRRLGIGIVIFGFVFLMGTFKVYLDRNTEIDTKQIKTISSQLAEELKIERTGGIHSVSRVIKIKLLDYRDHTFNLGGNSFIATETNRLLNAVKIGDTIELDIKLEAFEKKISKTKDLSFFDKTVGYHYIPIYGIRKGNSEYLKLSDYNLQHKKNATSIGFWTLVLVAFGVLIHGVYMLIVNKKSTI